MEIGKMVERLREVKNPQRTDRKNIQHIHNLNVLRKSACALCKHADLGIRVSIQEKAVVPPWILLTFLNILFG